MTDDQGDLVNNTHPAFMPALNRWVGNAGTRLPNFLVSTGVCCPARVSLLTGKYAHCHTITGNGGATGGFSYFSRIKSDQDWLPLWLQQAGYNTYLVGKFLNGFLTSFKYLPRGWTEFDAMTGNIYAYYNTCFSRNLAPDECYIDQYSTDVITRKTLGYLDSALASDKPFFMLVAPVAPHQRNDEPPAPAIRHFKLYSDQNIKVPRGANWGVVDADFPVDPVSMTPSFEADADAFHLAQLRSLRGVDEMLDAMLAKVAAAGQLDNTYIIYLGDNGIHKGQHAQDLGKSTPIEEDLRVPFFMRGPGIPAGAQLPFQGSTIDVAPTIMKLAGLPVPGNVDGLPLPLSPSLSTAHVTALTTATDASAGGHGSAVSVTPSLASSWRRDSIVLEAWDSDTKVETNGVVFKSLRVCTPYKAFSGSGSGVAPALMVAQAGTACYKYTVWCSGKRQLFDLSTDPYEIRNRIADPGVGRFVDRLDGVLSALAHCRAASCHSPYGLLHPGQGVTSFAGTMDPKYDKLYGSLVKFRFRGCSATYDPQREPAWSLGIGPQPADFL